MAGRIVQAHINAGCAAHAVAGDIECPQGADHRLLEPEHVLHEVVADRPHHLAEHVEALALPLGERVLLTHRAQVDALLQVVHLVEVLAPLAVENAEHHAPLELANAVFDRLGGSHRAEQRSDGDTSE